MKLRFALPLAVFFGQSALAANIEDVYRAARDNDPVLRGAIANHQARQEVVPQSRAQLLPIIQVQGSTTDNRRGFGPQFDANTGRVFEPPDQNFNDHNWSASARQPLVDVPSWFSYRSAKATAKQADFDYAATDQNLYTRVAEAYLNVLRAQARLESAVAEEEAVRRQLEQVQQRFDVGLVAITDVLESTAAYDAAVVRRIQADGDHDIFFESVRTITGRFYDEIDRLKPTLPIVDPDPKAEDEWVSVAQSTNLLIKSARQGLTAAERDLRARLSGHLPTIDVVASHARSQTGGSSFLGSRFETTSYSLQASMPLFQGGFTHSRFKEARFRVEEARQRLLEREFTVTRDTRNLYRAVVTGVVRVRARDKAIRSSESALEATQTGYEVGTRNIVDVLQAQQRLFLSQFDYADSRYNYVLDLLRLKQSAGTLAEEDLLELNQYTDPSNPVKKLTSLSGR